MYPQITWLQGRGCHVWYDEGIRAGSDWTEALASSIERSSGLLFFCSPASATSKHCVAEISYAIDNDLPVLVIYLEETSLSGGMKLRVNTHQAIFHYRLSRDQYETELLRGVNAFLAAESQETPTLNSSAETSKKHRSVAVIPFMNRSADVIGEELGDAIFDELITALSSFKELELAGKVASFALKQESNLDYEIMGARLGVEYVVSGSVQKSGNRVRIHALLDHVVSGHNVWSQRFDSTLDDVFELQDRIVSKVIDALMHGGELELGRLIGNRFLIDDVWKVGSGGIGDVYKALDLEQKDSGANRPYIALRLMTEKLYQSEHALFALQQVVARIRETPHHNIMKIDALDREGELVYMAMELLDGCPLDHYLNTDRPNGLDRADAVHIIDSVTSGLSAAHTRNIVHGDFKPGNIFYTADKVAKVFDFSIVEAFLASNIPAPLTPRYASCERFKTGVPSVSDDVYAVAVVAYQLLAGQHPFDETPSVKAREQNMKPGRIEGLSDRQWETIAQGLAFDVEDRLNSIEAFREGFLT